MEESRQLFPESRVVLVLFSPLLGLFLIACAFGVYGWAPQNMADTVGKLVTLELLLTAAVLCFFAFLGGIVGPDRVRRRIERTTAKLGLLGAASILGFVILVFWYGFTT